MNGVTKEGLVGWEGDGRYVHTPTHAAAIRAYRILKRSDYLTEANAVRDMANTCVIKSFQLEEATRKAAEGKGSQPWEEFIRPFAQMDAEQIADWIEEFKSGVVEEKQRQEEIKRQGRLA